MAELLQYSRHEEQYRKAEWMAVQKDTDVYLETVEIAEDPKTKVDRAGDAGMGSLWRSPLLKSLLENGRYRCGQKSANKRETDKMGLLWFSLSLSVNACQLLKTPCTEQYERWWCAMQGTQKMKAGPSTEIEQANLSNHSNAAVVKTMVVSD